MSKSLDRVLQPDGSYKWQETELIHSGKLVEPVVEPEPEDSPAPKSKRRRGGMFGNELTLDD